MGPQKSITKLFPSSIFDRIQLTSFFRQHKIKTLSTLEVHLDSVYKTFLQTSPIPNINSIPGKF
jgi:hypothetical protein